MPPRYAYWTILIDDRPTAFRARDKAELLPTYRQLQATNPRIAFKWFARGRLWESPEEAHAAARRPQKPREARTRDWRPGGEHRDPRARFTGKRGGSARRVERSRPSAGRGPRRGRG